MIHINRPPAPTFLNDPSGKWVKETKEAIAHYKSGSSESFEFEMYNDARLKDELKKVFVKCAYCESIYGHVSDGDVEHFRPKGKVNEKNPQTPGYYWLANDWGNLFLACMHCNQRRKHILYGETTLTSYGKLDQFPVADESKRLLKHTHRLSKEEKVRLLINPCVDDPSKELEYEDKEAVVIPLTNKGKKSIEVFVLQRHLLVQERKKQLLLLYQQMDRVIRELVRFNNDNSAGQKKVFEDELKILLSFTEKEKPYAGMSRFFVKKFLAKNNIT
ncbi:hypothetical protein IQ13_1010 [Lacibacter cauensis]|uniref:TIGR02646 family protein n=1 Tax=Lacibacter cauensis TaxID=510947 RepID=A0A562SX69_9BACT|nr:hypothetical protein [Lacibacter cauensis]TWI85841.1 hypothetical protein IQ13_1010 [Lacibacter cauensis]